MADDITAPALPALQLTLPINPPIAVYPQRTISSVTLREPTAADLAAAAKAVANYAYRIALVAAVSELDPREVGEFGVSLLNTCTDYLFAWISSRAVLSDIATGGDTAAPLKH